MVSVDSNFGKIVNDNSNTYIIGKKKRTSTEFTPQKELTNEKLKLWNKHFLGGVKSTNFTYLSHKLTLNLYSAVSQIIKNCGIQICDCEACCRTHALHCLYK